MNTPAPDTVAPQPVGLRVLRSIALLGLALIFTLLLGLALLSSSSLLRVAAASLFQWGHETSTAAGVYTICFIVLTPIAFLVLAWRLRLRSWWWIAGGYLATVPVLVYLAVDDSTLRHPITIDEVSPAFPGAENSFAVLMRYGKNHPLGRDFHAPDRIFRGGKPAYSGDPSKAEDWRAFLIGRRADIEADWADLAPVHAWWIELSTFDRIGDLTPTAIDAEIMAFAPTRSYSQHAIAIAGLQALDGHGDEAIATLLPVLQVARRLQPSARTLVRFMIAIVVEKMTLQAATFVLDHATVSPAMKAKLAAALAGGCRGEAGARRLVGIEYSLQLGALLDKPIGDLFVLSNDPKQASDLRRRLFNAVSPFVYNPRRTFNFMGDLNSEIQDLAARRDPMLGARATALVNDTGRGQFKNFLGSIIAVMSMPAYTKVVASYWTLQDLRDAVAARLNDKT